MSATDARTDLGMARQRVGEELAVANARQVDTGRVAHLQNARQSIDKALAEVDAYLGGA